MDLVNAALRTDLYELTMLQGYWAHGRAAEEACFEVFFRTVPEGGGYCIAAGIEDAIELCLHTRFSDSQLGQLAARNIFRDEFLRHLSDLRFTGEIRAVAEGTVVFPNEPIFEVTGPIIEAQWLETQLLNCINFQTLIATKASRICSTAAPASVIDFGLRRAHGPNGGYWATKAAAVGGCAGTSNVEAGLDLGLPIYGTHAHSWVMSYDSELQAFRDYAAIYPDSTVLLIDTFDTLKTGLPHAITVAKELERQGHQLKAVRLDSGDLAYLSKAVRRGLDDAGLPYVKILASSDIDEYVVAELKRQEARIDVYGVGTRLVTAFQEPALGGVYKIVALRKGGDWQPKVKISSNPAKTTIPARKQIWRWEVENLYQGDALSLVEEEPPSQMRHPDLTYKQTTLKQAELAPMLIPRVIAGERVTKPQSTKEAQAHAKSELQKLPLEHQRLANPHTYRVGLSDGLWNLRRAMIEEAINYQTQQDS